MDVQVEWLLALIEKNARVAGVTRYTLPNAEEENNAMQHHFQEFPGSKLRFRLYIGMYAYHIFKARRLIIFRQAKVIVEGIDL